MIILLILTGTKSRKLLVLSSIFCLFRVFLLLISLRGPGRFRICLDSNLAYNIFACTKCTNLLTLSHTTTLFFSMPVTKQNRFLLLYGSQTGQAKAIAEEIAEKSAENHLHADIHCLSMTEKKVYISSVLLKSRTWVS